MKKLGKVLIIEDDSNWQHDLKEILESANFYVEVVDNLEMAIEKIKKELFHFITIDMQLIEASPEPPKFEGWTILKVIDDLHIRSNTPIMVITGFEQEYSDFIKETNFKYSNDVFFMGKGAAFSPLELIDIVTRSIKQKDLRFNDDHRTS